MTLTDADLQEIIRLLDDSQYDELEVETGRFRLLLRRAGGGVPGWNVQRQTLSSPNVLNAPRPGGHSAGESTAQRSSAAEAEAGLANITAPLVGIFYRAPRPGADPFVETGSRVGPDTVVAIIEVMKLMYSVVAGMSGEVVEICAENGELVQQGQRLMLVRVADDPSGGSDPV